MKKTFIFLTIFICIALIVCIFYLSLNSLELDKTELLSYLNKNVITNGYNYSIKTEKDINNKHLILFTYNQMNSNSEIIGIAVFRTISAGRYKYEKFLGNSNNINLCTVNTKNNQSLTFTVFYGLCVDGYPKQYKIVLKNQVIIEKLSYGEYFIKYYPMDDSNEIKILPI